MTYYDIYYRLAAFSPAHLALVAYSCVEKTRGQTAKVLDKGSK